MPYICHTYDTDLAKLLSRISIALCTRLVHIAFGSRPIDSLYIRISSATTVSHRVHCKTILACCDRSINIKDWFYRIRFEYLIRKLGAAPGSGFSEQSLRLYSRLCYYS